MMLSASRIGITLLGLTLKAHYISAFISPINSVTIMASASSSSALDMARNRGLERREEGATPLRKLLMNNLQYCVDPVEQYRDVNDILLFVYDSIGWM